ncbi:MAG: Ig-like domain-containing protein, partial [Pseudomonadota bacterium]
MRLMSAPRAHAGPGARRAIGAIVFASGLFAAASGAQAQSQTVNFGPQAGGATGADISVSVPVPAGAVLADGATLTLSSQGDIDTANANPSFDELLTVQAGAATLTSFRVPGDCVADPAGTVDTRAIAIPGPTLAAAVSGGSLTLNFVASDGVNLRCPGGGVFAGLGPFNLAVVGSVEFSVPDTTPPAAPTIDLAAASDTGVSDGDDLTSVTTPTIEGAAEANATVTIRSGATVVATTTADGSGAFSAATTTLPEGASTLTATATDAAGNESAASAGLAVTIDTTRPGVTVSDPASGTRGGPFDLTITFTEDATGFTQGDVS